MPVPASLVTALGRSDPLLYAATNFSTASYYATQSGGGEGGDAGGFFSVLVYRPRRLAGVTQFLAGRATTGDVGHGIYSNTSGGLFFGARGGAGQAFSLTGAYVHGASDLGRMHCAIGRHDVTTLRLTVDRDIMPAIPNITGYTAAAVPHFIGALSGIVPSTDIDIALHATYRGTITDAEARELAVLVRRGIVPPSIGSATIAHYWSAKRELSRKPGAERKTYAARSFTMADYLSSPGGYAGVNGPFWIAGYATFDRVPAGTDGRFLQKSGNVNAGWRFLGYNGAVTFNLFGASPAEVNSPGATVLAQELGRPQLYVGLYTGTAVRLWARRQQQPGETALGTFTPQASQPLLVGRDTAVAASACAVAGYSGGPGLPSDDQLRQLFDDVERTGRIAGIAGMTAMLVDLSAGIEANGGTVPAGFADAASGSVLSRIGKLEAALHIASGPPAPIALIDATTRAPIDSMARVGSPTVVTIDPSRDGRRLLGAQGFSAANYLATEPGKGVQGTSSAVWFATVAYWRSAPGAETIAGTIAAGLATGWLLQTIPTLRVIVGTGTGWDGATYALAASDYAAPFVIAFRYAGGVLELWVRGVMVAAKALSYAPSGLPMQLGTSLGTASVLAGSLFAAIGGSTSVPTPSQMAEMSATFERTGRLEPIVGATEHYYDLTADYLPTESVTATVQDRIGIDHLTRVGGLKTSADNAVHDFSPEHFLRALEGGIAGVDTGFWVGALVSVDELRDYTRTIFGRANISTAGWYVLINNAVSGYTISALVANGASARISVATAMTRLKDFIYVSVVHTGSSIELYIDGMMMHSAPISGYMPMPSTTLFGRGSATSLAYSASSGLSVFGGGGGHHVPTAQELLAAATQSRADGYFRGVPGKTDRLWDIRADIEAASPHLPVVSPDRMGSNDAMVWVGAPLQLAQRTERIWSYEAEPVTRGVTPVDVNSGYRSSGIVQIGNSVSFWAAVAFVVTSQSVPAGARGVFSETANFTNGWDIRTSGTNSLMSTSFFHPTGQGIIGSAAISASDLGKILHYVFCWDGVTKKLRCYWKRAEVGIGSSFDDHKPSPTQLSLANMGPGALGSTGLAVLGAAAGSGVLTLPEVYAAYDAVMASESIVGIPGKTRVLYDLKADVGAASEAAPAQLVDRAAGSHPLSSFGSVSVHNQYARAFGW